MDRIFIDKLGGPTGRRPSRQDFSGPKGKGTMRVRLGSVIGAALLSVVLLIGLSGCPMQPPAAIRLGLSLIAGGFTHPVSMAVPRDGTGRIFIVDQIGKIWVINGDGTLLEEPFLDVSAQMVALQSFFDERGLLGLAFHPDFEANGRLFVFYNVPLEEDDPESFDSRVRVSEFTVSLSDANVADPDSEVVLLEVPKPQFNHNGGQLAFGPNGYLYIGIGDGGGENDKGDSHTPDLGNGQDTTTLLGKLLRYDVDTPGELRVPASNPFVGDAEVLEPIYAYGLRNPWRFSFDMGGGHRLFLSDVGQNLFEEIDIVTAGANFGWNIKEGSACFNPDNADDPRATCPDVGARGDSLVDPIIEYGHLNELGLTVRTAAIGGFVYRGTAMPDLVGRYIFGDFSGSLFMPDGAIFVAEEDASGQWQFSEAAIATEQNERPNRFILSFGQDEDGEVYVLTATSAGPTGSTGEVFKLVPASSDGEGAIEIDVENFRFDADDTNLTQVDTVMINVGDTVRWTWRAGVHTITSGEGSSAPDAGTLFDEPSDASNQTFSFTFNEAGTFPYFCRFHEAANMKGMIVVQ